MVHGICRTARYGSVTFWAWSVSIVIHLVVLLVFGVIKFSQSGPQQLQNVIPTASVTQIKKIIEAAPVVSKPKIKQKAESNFAKAIKPTVLPAPIFETEKPQAGKIGDLTKPTCSVADSSVSEQVLSPGTEFFGSYTDRRKVCFVVDCSGSMKGVLEQVKNRLKNSIQSLQADQYFYIIFFGSDRLFEFGNERLIRASVMAKSDACDFIDRIRASGQTNAMVALERAIQIRDSSGISPAVIYFLTDGFELTNQNNGFAWRITNLLNRYAPETKINTIGFWPDRNDRMMLQTIARQSGGEFVIINQESY